jgi:hypothetical protein
MWKTRAVERSQVWRTEERHDYSWDFAYAGGMLEVRWSLLDATCNTPSFPMQKAASKDQDRWLGL